MLTGAGAELLLRSLLTGSDVILEVTDGGDQSATAPMDDGFPELGVDDEGDPILAFQATFGADVANFEWAVRRVEVGDVVIDETTEDLGRKAGAVWTLQTTLELTPDAVTE